MLKGGHFPCHMRFVAYSDHILLLTTLVICSIVLVLELWNGDHLAIYFVLLFREECWLYMMYCTKRIFRLSCLGSQTKRDTCYGTNH